MATVTWTRFSSSQHDAPVLAEIVTLLAAPLAPFSTDPDREKIRRIASGHSVAISPQMIFECPLDSDAGGLDFSLELRIEPLRHALLHEPADRLLPPALTAAERQSWRRIAAFCRDCADDGSPLRPRVQRIWLEFDTSQEERWQVPSVFFELDPAAASELPRPAGLSVAQRAFHWLADPPVPPSILDRLRAWAAALPPSSAVLGLGVMVGRARPTVRFCTAAMPRDRLADYLRAIGGTASLAAVREAVPCLPGYEERCRVTSDLSQATVDRLGVEILAPPEQEFRSAGDFRTLLDDLAVRGFCTPARRRAVEEWIGESDRPRSGSLVPEVILRDISHLKLTFERGNLEGVKVYLHALHLPPTSWRALALYQRRGG